MKRKPKGFRFACMSLLAVVSLVAAACSNGGVPGR
jgi:hypothetical protein